MNIATFHAELKEKLKFPDLVSKLAEVSGYKPLFRVVCEMLVERLEPLGIEEPPLGLSGLRVEVLMADDAASFIMVRMSPRFYSDRVQNRTNLVSTIIPSHGES